MSRLSSESIFFANNMAKKILTGPIIFTNAEDNPVLESGAILMDDGKILAVGQIKNIKQANPETMVISLGNGLITPGLVNIHHHLYSSLARGWNPGGESPENFPQVLDRIWWKLDKALQTEDIYYSAIVGLCESVLSGVTSVIDHHASYGSITGSLDSLAEAFDLIGVKGSLCFELSDRGGKNAFKTGLKETVDALKKWPGISKNSRLQAMVGLHASMTLSDESLNRIREATDAFKAGYHFHLAEDISDQDDCQAKYGMRIVERFAKFGLLGKKSLAIHGVHLSKDEIKLLRDTKTNLALCPRSNQNNAVGFSQWWKYKGVTAGIGTDGIGSDMISETKALLYLSRHICQQPDFGFGLTEKLLLENNPKIFRKITGHRIGKIAPGYPADLVLWRYNSPTPISKDNIWGHYLYGLYNKQADSVWINGKRVLRQGEFINFDYNELLVKAAAVAKNLWERA